MFCGMLWPTLLTHYLEIYWYGIPTPLFMMIHRLMCPVQSNKLLLCAYGNLSVAGDDMRFPAATSELPVGVQCAS